MTVVTFAVAYPGYLGLWATAVAHAADRRTRQLTIVTAAVIAAHVLLVWRTRYEWSPPRRWLGDWRRSPSSTPP